MPLPLSASERSQRARIAAYSLHAKRDPKETTRKAQTPSGPSSTTASLRIFRRLSAKDAPRPHSRLTWPDSPSCRRGLDGGPR